jgi:hypothetical protein
MVPKCSSQENEYCAGAEDVMNANFMCGQGGNFGVRQRSRRLWLGREGMRWGSLFWNSYLNCVAHLPFGSRLYAQLLFTQKKEDAMRLRCLLPVMLLGIATASVSGAPFQNLGFESASVEPAPVNFTPVDAFDPISAAAALPGWTTIEDSTVTNAVWGDPIALDETSVALVSSGAIVGKHSVVVTSYADAPNGLYHSASISQTGDIVAGVRSIHFSINGNTGVHFGVGPMVSINGVPIAVFETSFVGVVSQWEGDVSAFAGTTAQLMFTAAGVPGSLSTDEDGFELDAISFSAQAVPEPATLGVLVCAGISMLMRRPRRLKAG